MTMFTLNSGYNAVKLHRFTKFIRCSILFYCAAGYDADKRTAFEAGAQASLVS